MVESVKTLIPCLVAESMIIVPAIAAPIKISTDKNCAGWSFEDPKARLAGDLSLSGGVPPSLALAEEAEDRFSFRRVPLCLGTLGLMSAPRCCPYD